MPGAYGRSFGGKRENRDLEKGKGENKRASAGKRNGKSSRMVVTLPTGAFLTQEPRTHEFKKGSTVV